MTLPIVISPGDPGHIGHHEEIHELLARLDGQTDFLVGGVYQDALASLPAAGAGNTGLFRYATDIEALDYSDGSVWHRIFRQDRPWVDVTDPGNAGGAVGDGVADDTAEVVAAVAAAKSGAGAPYVGNIVYFPKGTYNVSHSTLAVTDTVGIIFKGAGSRGWSNDRVPVSTIVVDGTGSNAASFGIKLEGSSANYVRNVVFEDLAIQYNNSFAGDLVRGVGASALGVSGFDATRCSFGSTSSTQPRPVTAASLVRMLGGHHYRFKDCTFTDAVLGVSIDNTGSAETNGWAFHGCSFFDFSTAAIACVGPGIKGLSIVGCDFDPLSSADPTQALIICAVGFDVRGCNFAGSGLDYAPTTAWVHVVDGEGTIAANYFGTNLGGVCIKWTAGNIVVEGNRGNCRKAILAEATTGLLRGGSNYWIHESVITTDDAIDLSAMASGGIDYGPDRFDHSTNAFRRSVYLPSSTAVGGTYKYHAEQDTSTNGPVAVGGYDSVEVVRTNKQENTGSGSVTLTTRGAGGVFAPATNTTYTLPDIVGAMGMSFTFIKSVFNSSVTIQRAGADIIIGNTSNYATLTNATTEYGVAVTVRARLVAGNRRWVVEDKTGTWTLS